MFFTVFLTNIHTLSSQSNAASQASIHTLSSQSNAASQAIKAIILIPYLVTETSHVAPMQT